MPEKEYIAFFRMLDLKEDILNRNFFDVMFFLSFIV